MKTPTDIRNSGNRRIDALGRIDETHKREHSDETYARRVMAREAEKHLLALAAEIDEAAEPLLASLNDFEDSGPLSTAGTDFQPGGKREAELRESRQELMRMDATAAAVVVREAAAENDFVPLLALDSAPAALRTKAQKILRSWHGLDAPDDLTTLRRRMRTVMTPALASKVDGVHAQLRELLEAGNSAAHGIGKFDPRTTAFGVRPTDFVPALHRIKAVLPRERFSLPGEARHT